MLRWTIFTDAARAYDALGFIPSFLDEDDPRGAAQQIAEKYIGGWHHLPGFTMDQELVLHYFGDPPLTPIATVQLRHETVIVYRHAWVAIRQPNGTFEVSRCD